MSTISVKPKIIVCDFSWALLHGIAQGLNGISLVKLLNMQWYMLIDSTKETNIMAIRLCNSHYIKAVSRRLAKMGLPNLVRHFNFTCPFYSFTSHYWL